MDNNAIIEKTLESSDLLNGGTLNSVQQTKFVELVKDYSKLLGMVRFERMPRPLFDVDKIHLGEPVTESVDENTDTGNLSKTKFNQVQLIAQKLRSAWNVTTETLQGNIEQNNIETTIMNMMMVRISTDLELLAMQGDSSIVGTDPISRLLARLDGWDIQTDEAHIVDAGGSTISKSLFSQMLRTMPKSFIRDPGLKWLVSDAVWTDWIDLLSDRGTLIGDRALQGEGIAPFGIPMEKIPSIPDDKPVTISAATSAFVVGTEFDPFTFSASNNTLNIDVDNAGVVAVVLPTGTLNVSQVANAINAADPSLAGVARSDREGSLVIESPTLGASSEVDIQASTSATTLGLTVAVVVGVDAGSGGNVNDGSFILLTNPKNLIWGQLDGTRIFTEFNKNFDRIETIIYNQVDAKLENIDAIVKATNIRKRRLL